MTDPANDKNGAFSPILAAFSSAWLTGGRPRIEAFLDCISESERPTAFTEFLKAEIVARRDLNEFVSLGEYLERFPDREADVREIVTQFDDQVTRIGSEVVDEETVDEFAASADFGRYRIGRVLGKGGFGEVYAAFDPDLERAVAIKVISADVGDPAELMKEARHAARLRHPGIVTIYDVVSEAPRPFIVQEHVRGETLQGILKSGKPFARKRKVEIIIAVAEALSHAHSQRVIHRDIKPSNIVIDQQGQPRIIDFGLALRERPMPTRKSEIAGTLRFMPPEQCRGEMHRLDDRSDLWSLGVILYFLMTGRYPFDATNAQDLHTEIQFRDPVPPRQISSVSVEMERIIEKCLAKRMADRYPLCRDLIADLGACPEALGTVPGQDSGSVNPGGVNVESEVTLPTTGRIVPRGLLAFGRHDADFFPRLLPGPYDRDGIPPGISFWLERLASFDPNDVFPLGIVYGRSGCGKSSLVQAGVLPRLPDDIVTVYVDCTDADTEHRILAALRSKVTSVSESTAATAIRDELGSVRESFKKWNNRRVLIVLDQFEQWLHGRSEFAHSELTLALRQCDGMNLQALIIVRDDFWMATSAFMHELEIPIHDGHNAMAVEMFSPKHARHVLEQFGLAYGTLPADPKQRRKDHDAFLDESINGLTTENRVPSVVLSLFAHMLREREWTRETLRALGGPSAITTRFLEDTFDGQNVPLALRSAVPAATQILEMLIPEHGKAIKGHMRSYAELQNATALREAELDEVLRVLETELSLIAVADSGSAGHRRYRLTHDHIVDPVRTWLKRKQASTARGRAMVRLRESAAHWKNARDNRLLPTVRDYARFRYLVPQSALREHEQEFLHEWRRRYGIRTILGILLAGILLIAGLRFIRDKQIEASDRVFVQAVEEAESEPVLLEAIRRLRAEGQAPEAAVETLRTHSNPKTQIRGWLAKNYAVSTPLTTEAATDLCRLLPEADDFEARMMADVLSYSPAGQHEVLRQLEQSRETIVRSRLAAILLAAGNTHASVAGLAAIRRDTPAERRLLTHYAGRWLPRIQRSTLDPETGMPAGLRSVILNTATLAWERLSAADRLFVRDVCREYLNHPNPGLHAAAQQITDRIGDARPTSSIVENRVRPFRCDDWFENAVGLKMIRLTEPSNGAKLQTFMADRDITFGQIRMYLATTDDLPPVVPDLSHAGDRQPYVLMQWDFMAHYCNWLSLRERRDPVFVRESGKWKIDLSRNGYRLPRIGELKIAAGGGSVFEFITFMTTDWLSDSKLEVFHEYEVTGAHPLVDHGQHGNRTAAAASLLPNALGFFDTVGNVKKWAIPQPTNEPPRTPFELNVFGGDCRDYRLFRYLRSREFPIEDARTGVAGLRVVATGLPPD